MAAAPARAHADEVARCSDAADKGQELRDAHKLVEARERLRVCAHAQCPSVIQRECAKWLDDVDASLPTVVLSAKDPRGAQLVDVAVSVDGRPFATQLDGQARPIDPGVHTFRFESTGGAISEQKAAVREGEKNQRIAVQLEAPSVPSPAPLTPSRADPWRTTGWAVGIVGVIGLGVGAVFGVVATLDKSRAHCDAGGFCDAEPLASARRHATASTITFVAGGLLVAGGAGLVLFAPSGDPARAGALRAAPRVSATGAGLTFEGLW